MILQAFAEHLKKIESDIPPFIILAKWIKDILSKEAEDNVEKVIHEEIAIVKDENGVYLLAGKSPSGVRLLEALYNYAQSYEQQSFSRWVHHLKASDFKELID